MADAVARIDPDATMKQVVDLLDADEIGLLLVGSIDNVVGVVSERDVVRMLATGLDPATTKVIDMASTSPVWCEVDAMVHEVAELMMEHYVRHVLVRDRGTLVGIVSARDLLGAYTAASD
jgi:CBS domain-containing protein